MIEIVASGPQSNFTVAFVTVSIVIVYNLSQLGTVCTTACYVSVCVLQLAEAHDEIKSLTSQLADCQEQLTELTLQLDDEQQRRDQLSYSCRVVSRLLLLTVSYTSHSVRDLRCYPCICV